MGKSRLFSFYLLKSGETPESVVIESASLSEAVSTPKIPADSVLRLGQSSPRLPWWKDYFGIDQKLYQQAVSAILFLPVNERWFAISFGLAFHCLNKDKVEHDFGLRVTLNCVDPDNLKSTDTVEPSGARRRRTQIPIASDLTSFDFDRDSTILKQLTGTVREEYKPLFKNITGAANVKLTSTVTPDELTDLAKKLLEIYQSKQFEKTLPDIHNIVPVRDPIILKELDSILLKSINNRSLDVSLAIPHIVNFDQVAQVKFKGLKTKIDTNDVDIDDYFRALSNSDPNQSNQIDNTETLKKHCVELVDDNGEKVHTNSIWASLVFYTELTDQDATFHLSDGNWYKVNKAFGNKLIEDLDRYWRASTLPDYHHASEGEYNREVAQSLPDIYCLDGKNISPQRETQIEPCDLMDMRSETVTLLHVKRSTRSSSLSHLFSQATTATELLILEEVSREKLVQLVEDDISNDQQVSLDSHLTNSTFSVGYVVITKKPPSNKSKNFPLFSRINLRRALRDLHARGCDPTFKFVN